MQNFVKTCIFGLALTFFLAGCGQKGPLFLPGDPSEIRSVPPAEPAERADDEEDDEQDNVPR